jgi:hypothetical protein
MIGDGDCEEIGLNKDWQAKPKHSEKTFLSATLSTTNSTWLDPGLNPGCRGVKPATNRLSYGAALKRTEINIIKLFLSDIYVPLNFYHEKIRRDSDYGVSSKSKNSQ